MSSEHLTDRDGVFSYDAEIHAFLNGIGVGISLVADGVRGDVIVKAFTSDKGMAESTREPWYFSGGIMTGIGIVIGADRYRDWRDGG